MVHTSAGTFIQLQTLNLYFALAQLIPAWGMLIGDNGYISTQETSYYRGSPRNVIGPGNSILEIIAAS